MFSEAGLRCATWAYALGSPIYGRAGHVAPPVMAGQSARVVASRSHMYAQMAEFIDQFGAHEIAQLASSLKFCRIAEGAADVCPRLGPTCEWDTAAPRRLSKPLAAMCHNWMARRCALARCRYSIRILWRQACRCPICASADDGGLGAASVPRLRAHNLILLEGSPPMLDAH